MNEPLGVNADLSVAPPRPRSFRWHGTRRLIVDVGRQWTDDRGRLHYLVRTSEAEVYELAYQPAEGTWWLLRTPAHFGGPGQRV